MPDRWQPLADRDWSPGAPEHRTVVELTLVFRYQGQHAHSTAVADAELRVAGAGPTAEIVGVHSYRPALGQPADDEDVNPPAPGAFSEAAEVAEAAQGMSERALAARDALALGIYDGAHHKNYALDQAARALLGDGYAAWVASQPGWAELAEGSCPP